MKSTLLLALLMVFALNSAQAGRKAKKEKEPVPVFPLEFIDKSGKTSRQLIEKKEKDKGRMEVHESEEGQLFFRLSRGIVHLQELTVDETDMFIAAIKHKISNSATKDALLSEKEFFKKNPEKNTFRMVYSIDEEIKTGNYRKFHPRVLYHYEKTREGKETHTFSIRAYTTVFYFTDDEGLMLYEALTRQKDFDPKKVKKYRYAAKRQATHKQREKAKIDRLASKSKGNGKRKGGSSTSGGGGSSTKIITY